MSAESYEIEIKSLLGAADKANEFRAKLQADPNLKIMGQHKQLNHYFEGGELKSLTDNIKEYIPTDKQPLLVRMAAEAKDYSVRTRWADGKVIFVIKASVDDTTSANGTARLEFEVEMPLTLEALDQLILNAGFTYQAKWSREREEFESKGANITIDKNAGYGYLAEFEVVENDKSKVEEKKSWLRQIMRDLGVEELPQDRLARMFDHYNKHWEEYYGTDKVFNIE